MGEIAGTYRAQDIALARAHVARLKANGLRAWISQTASPLRLGLRHVVEYLRPEEFGVDVERELADHE